MSGCCCGLCAIMIGMRCSAVASDSADRGGSTTAHASLARTGRFRTFFDDALAKRAAPWRRLTRASGAMIGLLAVSGARKRAMAARSRSAGPFWRRACWGGAFNHDMKRLMLAHALASVAECRFLVGAGNTRSRRALERSGARLTGRIERNAQWRAETVVPHLTYVITRDDFCEGAH